LGRAEYPNGVSFPVTAFFRIEGSLADLGACRAGRLELYNPLTIQAVDVGGRMVPLETNVTTPLAYYLAHSKLDGLDYEGFLSADRVRHRTGMHMLAPYQRGKIPVVLVHGLLSSPLTWAPVFNDLAADPILRERFQFWYYFYPTGNPYLMTAADLRRDLDQLRTDLDPKHEDAALDNMVFVGHSMGGLISRLLTTQGGDDFWRIISDRPLGTLKLKDDTREELRQTFYFKPQTCVKRVIYLGTPHHGSLLSPSLLGRLGVRLIHFPRTLLAVTKDVTSENPDLALTWRRQQIPTSVDLLAPDSPALEVLAARPHPPGVHYHSVIGVIHSWSTDFERWLAGASCEPSDGVVTYRSAHLDEVDSELVVPADHFTVHHHPLSVLEVRRILLEHLEEWKRTASSLQPEQVRP
jgi:pimeloyl-ACP methyl ester carboxylesterase